MIERTLVIIKPDGVKRNLVDEIIHRYESAGLKIIAKKTLQCDKNLAKKHYPDDENYLRVLGQKSKKEGSDADIIEEGRKVVRWAREYIMEGPVVAMVLEGENAVQKVRDITGYTNPPEAKKGTIRGDLGVDDIATANREQRAVRNLIHASGNLEEARKEIELWFGKDFK